MLNECSLNYYKDEKAKIKRKQRRLLKESPLNVRYNFKLGYFSEIQ